MTELLEPVWSSILREIGWAQVFLRFRRNSCAWVRLLNVTMTELSGLRAVFAYL